MSFKTMLMEVSSTKLAKNRSEIYQMFSALLCEPEDEILSEKRIFRNLKENFEAVQPNQAHLVDNLAVKFSAYSIRELLIDYTKIFLGPFKAIALPYSSVYFGENSLMTGVTAWVEQFYHKCGLSFDYSIRDLPDHIVVELEFMYQLAFKEWEARSEDNDEEAAKYLNLQKEFITGHLAKWGVKMSNTIIESNQNEYYSALSECLRAFLKHEKMSLAISQN